MSSGSVVPGVYTVIGNKLIELSLTSAVNTKENSLEFVVVNVATNEVLDVNNIKSIYVMAQDDSDELKASYKGFEYIDALLGECSKTEDEGIRDLSISENQNRLQYYPIVRELISKGCYKDLSYDNLVYLENKYGSIGYGLYKEGETQLIRAELKKNPKDGYTCLLADSTDNSKYIHNLYGHVYGTILMPLHFSHKFTDTDVDHVKNVVPVVKDVDTGREVDINDIKHVFILPCKTQVNLDDGNNTLECVNKLSVF